jgi:hypothetical protein
LRAALLAPAFLLVGCTLGLQQNVYPDESVSDDGAGGITDPEAAQEEEEELEPTEVGLEGKLYSVTARNLTITEPAGLDAMAEDMLDKDILVYVEEESADELTMMVALSGTDGLQDPCETVREFPAADWSQNPVFDVGPTDLDASFGGEPAQLRDVRMSGVFDRSGFAWRDGTLSAIMDARELEGALGDIDVCELVQELGGSCNSCRDGKAFCFALEIEDILAEKIEADFDTTPGRSRCN